MLARREVLAVGLLPLLRKCQAGELMGRRAIAYSSDDDWRVYNVGNFRVTIGKPRVLVTAGGAAGSFAWFAGVHRDPVTGNSILRWSDNFDDTGPGHTKAVISSDNNQTFPLSTVTTVEGKPSPQEPCVQGADGSFKGGEFWRWEKVGGNPRILRCGYNTWTAGFTNYVYTPSACTITGFTADIGSYGADPGISWTDRVVRISDAQWISTVQVSIPSIQGQIFSYVIESTDQGHNWTVVGSLTAFGAAAVGSEGFSEVTTFRCTNGDLVSIGRCGPQSVARVRSTDLGRTWSAPDTTLGPWWKSPCANLLSSGDYALMTGYISRDPYVVQRLAPAQFALCVSSDPMAANWPIIDLVDHHNRMLPSLAFSDTLDVSTGYGNYQEMPGGTATKANIFAVYDQCGHSRGTATTRPDRIFGIDARIERMS